MKRREFFRRTVGALAAAVIGPRLAPVPPFPFKPLADRDSGISIRFIKQFDLVESRLINRFDTFIAAPLVNPDPEVARTMATPAYLQFVEHQRMLSCRGYEPTLRGDDARQGANGAD